MFLRIDSAQVVGASDEEVADKDSADVPQEDYSAPLTSLNQSQAASARAELIPTKKWKRKRVEDDSFDQQLLTNEKRLSHIQVRVWEQQLENEKLKGQILRSMLAEKGAHHLVSWSSGLKRSIMDLAHENSAFRMSILFCIQPTV